MNPAHERRMRDVLAEEHPELHGLVSAPTCCSEYREYERSVTTLVDAFVKPRVAAYVASIASGCRLGRLPFYIMKSNGGVIAGPRGRTASRSRRSSRAGGGHARARRSGRRAGGLRRA